MRRGRKHRRRPTNFFSYFLLTMFFFIMPCSTFADIYRWKNSQGQIHYSSSPPSHQVNGSIEVKRNGRWLPYTGKPKTRSSAANTETPIMYSTSRPGNSPRPAPELPDQLVIPYNKHASMILVDVTLNQTLTKTFAVDTGATFTAISQEVADALFLLPDPDTPPITVQTANGQIQVPLVNLDSVAVGGLAVPNITAGIHQFESDALISGLLGLNFLNHFQMTVDAKHKHLLLTPLEPFTRHEQRDCAAARKCFHDAQQLHDDSDREADLYRKAISLCPDFVEAYYRLGAIYIRRQDADHALDIHRIIARMQPDEPEAHFRLGLAYLLTRNVSEAKQEFETALELDPTHQQAQEYMDYVKNFPHD